MNFDKKKYKIYTWKNWMMLHWILNPGLIVNELILGQRVPKITLEDKISDKPRLERSFVPCPHCETLHDARTWSTHNGTAFKNWFGLYCTNCGKTIPCLLNIFSFILLLVTFPLWGWFRKGLKRLWLQNQPKRFTHIDIENTPNPFNNKSWIHTGLSWGAIMFVMMTLIFPYLDHSEIRVKSILLGVVVWSLAGLLFGYIMKVFFQAIGNNKAS